MDETLTLTPAPEAPRAVTMRGDRTMAPGAGAALLHEGFRLVGVVDDVPPLQGRVTSLAGRRISVFRLADGFAVVEGACPHAHSPRYGGSVSDGEVGCPIHSWWVDPATGIVADGPGPVAVHEIRERDGLLYVRLSGSGSSR